MQPSGADDLRDYRRDFPALAQTVHGDKPLVYLDSAATALKPRCVIEAVTATYASDAGSVHRAVHALAQRATAAYEGARETVRGFLNAASRREIIFVRGTTEAINLIAQSYARPRLRSGDEILITELEHHSNIVPWQMVCEQTGARLVIAPITQEGEVPLAGIEKGLSSRTRIVACAHVSNALGTVLPLADITRMAHAAGAVVVVDGAQAVPHMPVDVAALGVDFYAFSGHKLYGPSGIGVLYGREALLERMPPYQGGGDMIKSVSFERTLYSDLPHKFEAGTPHVAGAVGLGAAIGYIQSIGHDRIAAREAELLAYAQSAIAQVPGVRIIGTAGHKIGVVSFVMDAAHPHDIGTIVDLEGVAIRTGHHCAEPVMQHFGITATARASLGLYNHAADIDALVRALDKVRALFG